MSTLASGASTRVVATARNATKVRDRSIDVDRARREGASAALGASLSNAIDIHIRIRND